MKKCLQCDNPVKANDRKYCSRECYVKGSITIKPYDERPAPNGYIFIYVPNHPNSNKKGWILKHRWIMSNKIGRPLKNKEIVHHINEIRDDNRIDNLQLLNIQSHMVHHQGRRKGDINDQMCDFITEKEETEIDKMSYLQYKENFNLSKEYIKTVIDLYNSESTPIENEETIELSFEEHLKARFKIQRLYYLAVLLIIILKD